VRRRVHPVPDNFGLNSPRSKVRRQDNGSHHGIQDSVHTAIVFNAQIGGSSLSTVFALQRFGASHLGVASDSKHCEDIRPRVIR
jgi:hypothetical protein